MSQTTPAPTPSKASFFARSRKAFSGAIAGGCTTAGSAIIIAFQDGVFSASDAWTVAGAFVGGALVAGVAVWNTSNADG
jgi:hypothetical protein